MTSMPRSVTALVAGVTASAVAAGAALAALTETTVHVTWALVLTAVLAIAEYLVVSRRMGASKWSWSPSEAVVALGLTVLSPAIAVVVVASAIFLGGYRRVGIKRVFNAAQHGLATAAAATVVALLGSTTTLTLVAAMLVYVLVNNGLVAMIVRAATAEPVSLRRQVATVSLGSAASVSIGIVAAGLVASPLYLALLVLPLLAVRLAYQAQVRRAERERTLRRLYENALTSDATEERAAMAILDVAVDAFGATRAHLELEGIEGDRTWVRETGSAEGSTLTVGATLEVRLPAQPEGPHGRLVIVDEAPEVRFDSFDRELAEILALHAAPTLRSALAAEQRDAAVALLREMNLAKDAVSEELARLART